MAELLMRLGSRLVFSRRNQCVRPSLVVLLVNALAVAGVVFSVELLVILLGLENVFLPLTSDTLSFLTELFF
jgi:hypothetical protein